jgi:hypothetical protein
MVLSIATLEPICLTIHDYSFLPFTSTNLYIYIYRTLTNFVSNEMQSGSRGKNWAKAVQKEWTILKNDLPGIRVHH